MNLPSLFAPSLQDAAERLGLEFRGKNFTFGEIDARSNRVANLLLAQGWKAGDRVAVYLKNCVELIDVYLACVKAGFIFTPINILYREGEIAHIVADAEPRVLIAHRESDEILSGVIARYPACTHWTVEQFSTLLDSQYDSSPPSSVAPESVAALVYTSGTTGRPKGAMLSHRNFAANANNLVDGWRMDSSDRLLLALPLFHVHGLGNGVHTWLAQGYRSRLLERFDKETIIQEFLDFKPTVFFGVPTMYVRLLETDPDIARQIGETVRLFVSGSAPLPAATLEQFRELFGHVILERYGMSETLMLISNPYDGERRPGSVGHPLPGVAVRICDPFSEKDLPDGEAGEVLVKGENVFSGYWRNAAATNDSFTKDGFFRTGDVGVRSADGYYTLQGRLRELIISGGFNIYPREVEDFVRNQPGVSDAAVIGVADAVRGEVPVVFIVPEGADSATPDLSVIEASCRNGLASFKVPRQFLLIDELPRNAMGKVMKKTLADRLRSAT